MSGRRRVWLRIQTGLRFFAVLRMTGGAQDDVGRMARDSRGGIKHLDSLFVEGELKSVLD